MNKIYFGDNLDVMRKHLPDNSVDLVYLDPPFNSKKAYNIIYNGEEQVKAFDDTWNWSDEIARTYDDIKQSSNADVIKVMTAFREILGKNNMMAYLVMMTPRLVEIQRILKPTGSVYLHCDPTASHYLKIIMDNIFGLENFRNEIVWCYKSRPQSKNYFGKKHDTLLFYSKSDDYYFNWKKVSRSLSDVTIKKYRHMDENGRQYRLQGRGITGSPIRSAKDVDTKWEKTHPELVVRDYLDEKVGVSREDWWTDINIINQAANERTGYPTQKPLTLLERIIKVSSNKGDIVLDPFCGCATTLVASEKLGRQWIGIDLTYQSVVLLKERLRKNHIHSETFTVEGEPTTIDGAKELIRERGRFRFQDWVTGRIGAVPNTKKTADEGEDGYYFWTDNNKDHKAIISVKSGHTGPSDIRDLKGTMKSKKATAGVFITLEEPTRGMRTEASSGYFKDSFDNRYPIVQILTVEDILEGKKVDLPDKKVFR